MQVGEQLVAQAPVGHLCVLEPWGHGFEIAESTAACEVPGAVEVHFARMLPRMIVSVNEPDGSPTAMAQGPTRRARGEAFVKYVNTTLGATHAIQIVPECGHNDRCMFTTDAVFPLIFPK
jgi:hypothetical protein